ncbi:signal peptidase II [Aquabacterium parvum]|uniref:signal peptidase II n=1 Tax=Aquabacterium parvum TaxID=70584 RepID=UPI002285F925|nr:signal peptidase II [Aquabacterium parvum]
MTIRQTIDPRVARAFLAAAFVFLIDTASKAAVVAALPYGSSEPWLPVLNIVHWRNEGAAFCILHDAGGWQRLFFSAVAVAASIVLVVLIRRPQTDRPQRLAFGLLLGGALGNLLDRLARGAVVDWIDVRWQSFYWPAFNVADIGITLGAALIVVCELRGGKTETWPR